MTQSQAVFSKSYSHTLNVKSKGERTNKQDNGNQYPNLEAIQVVFHCYNITQVEVFVKRFLTLKVGLRGLAR